MKPLRLLFVFAALFIFTNVNAQERYLTDAEIPAKIKTFVKNNFPKTDIVSVKEDKEVFSTEYEVKLFNMAELEFKGDFSIKKIESKKGIPAPLISKKVRDYVDKHYSNHKIVEWKKKKRGQEIELDNDLELYFDAKGNFLKLDD